MDLLATSEVRDATRQAAPAADADDVFLAARGGFCGPLRATDHAVASGRLPGACGPLHLHSVCARRVARLPSAVAPQSVPLRAHSGHHISFSPPPDLPAAPHPYLPPQAA